MKVLGLDVGNGKVKCCWIDFRGSWPESRIVWDSLPLPVSGDRPFDFEYGLPVQIASFLAAHGIEHGALDRIVVCCSHSFSYQPYSASISHLAGILARVFPNRPVALLRADGQQTPVAAIADLATRALYAYCLTNFYGSALLGSRLIETGLSLDLGTTTLDVIPICRGQIDPEGLAAPAEYLRYRYGHGRIHWLGLSGIPLTMLATEVPLGPARYQVVPRHYTTELLFGLAPADPDLLRRHAYGHDFPDPLTCRQRLAQFIGLDDQLLGEEEIQELRDWLFERLIDKVAAAIRGVAEATFPDRSVPLEIASFALGEQLVLGPALARAGFDPARVRTLALGRDQALWSASSVFAMALLALEAELGHSLVLT